MRLKMGALLGLSVLTAELRNDLIWNTTTTRSKADLLAASLSRRVLTLLQPPVSMVLR